jgi:hypothetical protein
MASKDGKDLQCVRMHQWGKSKLCILLTIGRCWILVKRDSLDDWS